MPSEFELYQLVLKSLDGKIVDKETDRLHKLLNESSEAVEDYVDLIITRVVLESAHSFDAGSLIDKNQRQVLREAVDRDLNDSAIRTAMKAEASVEDATPKPSLTGESNVRFTRRQLNSAFLKVAAMLLFALSAIYLDRLLWQKVNQPRVTPLEVATITDSEQAIWANEGFDPAAALTAGTWTLQQGIAELTFQNDAQVILEGPSTIMLFDGKHVMLEQGALTARVNRRALGFRVSTPTADILDLGTEFGVQVNASDVSEVHVFDGLVALYAENTQNRVLVEQGQARRVRSGFQVNAIPLSPGKFAKQIMFPVRSEISARDDFGYADGLLVGNSGGRGWSGPWIAQEGSAATVVAGVAQLLARQQVQQEWTEIRRDLIRPLDQAWIRATIQKTRTSGVLESFGGIGLYDGDIERALIGNFWPTDITTTTMATDTWGVGPNRSQGEASSALVTMRSDVIVYIDNAEAKLWINPADVDNLGTPDAIGNGIERFNRVVLRCGT